MNREHKSGSLTAFHFAAAHSDATIRTSLAIDAAGALKDIMRKRYQQGSFIKVDGNWIAQWWEDGHRRKRTLGRVSKLAKSKVQAVLDAILLPINSRASAPSPSTAWGEFVRHTYLPFYTRKWKLSARNTNEERFKVHLFPIYGERKLGSFLRDELQDLLDAKASAGLSYSTVAHLRWDLRQVFRMAVQEGIWCAIPPSCFSSHAMRSARSTPS